ncbi:DUF202 domain-containing protein [Microbacterium halophytorum]|uniref:DUF202 domain-containing protein n=1 Tax=Microbacterium halophytorum TaxID=2067568 RepID=UPI000CFD4568|nr:DUF202 domain-containing protein [Microbacterium halophytorum]
MSVPYDQGLQPERTLLAWRRTCLSFALASVVLTHYTAQEFGVIAVILGLLGAGFAATSYFLASHGYRRVHESLHARGATGGDGTPFLLATLAVLAIGASAAVYLVIAFARL